MKHHSKLTKTKIKELVKGVKRIRTNKKKTYFNIEASFDIETSSVETDHGEKFAFMYIAMFGIGYENDVYYMRTWEEVQEVFARVSEALNLNDDRTLIVYVHNLSYEFQFMRKYFEWTEVFAIDERKPLIASTSLGIEFRCSYLLSGYSLENVAKNLTRYEVEKMVGDLDYSLVRLPTTPLTDEEIGYCRNDIKVVNAYIKEQIEQYSDITKIPKTNTGRVRSYVRNNCYYTDTNHRKTSRGKYHRYRKIMEDLTLDRANYEQLKRAFMGGFVHANANYVNEVLHDVTSIDFTSSYPAVMLAEKYPMSRGKRLEQGVDFETIADFEELCKWYGIVFDVRFYGIESKISQENYLSESKCRNVKKPIINNGRIYSADMIETTLTNVDYDIMKQCYSWEGIEVTNVTRYHMAYLPKSIIESIVKLYEDKTVLKDVAGYEVEYMLSKGMLNSVYGMSVTDIVKDNHIYNDDWDIEIVDVDEEIEKYNKSKNRFLYYAWGIFVTAYARRNLWTGIIAMGDDYVYSDTDSIKFLNYEDHKPYIEWYDQTLKQKLKLMCDDVGIDYQKMKPRTKEGEEKFIGVWDYEGTYSHFKTLGSKRYLSYDDENGFALTVAGLSKQNGLQYMVDQCNGDVDCVFEMFNNNLHVPADKTGKMTHTYIDHTITTAVTDYLGNTEIVTSKSGIHLESAEFTLSLSEQFIELIQRFKEGYFYGGNKFE